MVAKALDHIAITVSDTERSLRFYRDALGLEQVEQHQLDGAKIEMALGVAGAKAQSTRLAAKGTPSILIDLMEFRAPAERARARSRPAPSARPTSRSPSKASPRCTSGCGRRGSSSSPSR